MSRCPFGESEPEKRVVLSDLCIGHVLLKVFRCYPHLSVMSLTYFTDIEHEYPYPHGTGRLKSQLS